MHRPKSLTIGLVTISAVAVAYLLAIVIDTFQLAKNPTFLIAVVGFVALISSISGLVLGLRFSSDIKSQKMLNRIGLILNALVFIGLMRLMSLLYFAFTHSPVL